MTEQEAIEELKSYRACSGTKYPEEIELAIQALEKQIPKKVFVKEYESGFKENRCPICKQQLSPFDIETYCGYCGQRLDWSE